MKQITRVIAMLCVAASLAQAQQPAMQYFRSYDKYGLNVFETNKQDSVPYTGIKVRIGGGFTQDYQMLKHSNTAAVKKVAPDTVTNVNQLANLTNGFNLAMADMYLDAQLEDGVRANVTMYLSARHHNEAWVKNGYLQVDKLDFLHVDALTSIFKYLTLKVGDLEVDYGDAHFRRVDGGNSVWNPFVENYIMDEFATEIGAEIYFHHESGFFAMVGATDGMLNPTITASNVIDSVTKSPNAYQPAFHFKVGYDKQINSDVRVRLTASMYNESSTSSSTLFGGDRTGSHYFLIMENTAATALATPASGRFNPGFSDQVSTVMINPFVKVGGFELFGTYEMANGRKATEVDTRKATQMAADLLYRFGATENFWLGFRYNQLKATMAAATITTSLDAKGKPVTAKNVKQDISINRMVVSAGWFITPNVMMKAEYVTQAYNDFQDIQNQLYGGKFSGGVVEAVLSF